MQICLFPGCKMSHLSFNKPWGYNGNFSLYITISTPVSSATFTLFRAVYSSRSTSVEHLQNIIFMFLSDCNQLQLIIVLSESTVYIYTGAAPPESTMFVQEPRTDKLNQTESDVTACYLRHLNIQSFPRRGLGLASCHQQQRHCCQRLRL